MFFCSLEVHVIICNGYTLLECGVNILPCFAVRTSSQDDFWGHDLGQNPHGADTGITMSISWLLMSRLLDSQCHQHDQQISVDFNYRNPVYTHSPYNAKFVVTCGIRDCFRVSLCFHRWRQSWRHGDFMISVIDSVTKRSDFLSYDFTKP